MSHSTPLSTSPTIQLPIIGYIHSPLSQKFGLPRQPNLVDVPCTLEFIAPYNDPLAFAGLENVSHVWLLWQFHQNKDLINSDVSPTFKPQVRPPRLGGNEKIGVFATRSMYRPANIGLSVLKLDKIIQTNQRISLQLLGGDMVDGTPVIDIKPYIAYSDSIAGASSGIANYAPMTKQVVIAKTVLEKLTYAPFNAILSDNDSQIIQQLIAQDPRPAYRQQVLHTQFTMRYAQVDCVFFQQDASTLVWCDIKDVA